MCVVCLDVYGWELNLTTANFNKMNGWLGFGARPHQVTVHLVGETTTQFSGPRRSGPSRSKLICEYRLECSCEPSCYNLYVGRGSSNINYTWV